MDRRAMLRASAQLVLVYGAAALLLGMILAVGLRAGLTPGALSRDVAATAGLDALTGLQSNLGVVIWWSGAVAALLGWTVLWLHGRACHALLWLGLVTAVLAVDDLLQIHEALAPRFLGIGEKAVLVGYALAMGAALLAGARMILRGPGVPVLVAALGLFALSTVVDLFQHRWESEWRVFVEDGLKFGGIVGWSAWLSWASLQRLREDLAPARAFPPARDVAVARTAAVVAVSSQATSTVRGG